LGGSAFRARLRGKCVKSAFFETCGQPPILQKEVRADSFCHDRQIMATIFCARGFVR